MRQKESLRELYNILILRARIDRIVYYATGCGLGSNPNFHFSVYCIMHHHFVTRSELYGLLCTLVLPFARPSPSLCNIYTVHSVRPHFRLYVTPFKKNTLQVASDYFYRLVSRMKDTVRLD